MVCVSPLRLNLDIVIHPEQGPSRMICCRVLAGPARTVSLGAVFISEMECSWTLHKQKFFAKLCDIKFLDIT